MSADPSIPAIGAVLGVDVGFSPLNATSAVCRVEWDQAALDWSIQRFRAIPAERAAVIAKVAGTSALLAAAFDGPLASHLDVIGRYRIAERMLTRKLGRHIGKPGQSSVPVGRQLNAAANACANAVLQLGTLLPSTHGQRINASALVEAFPTAFLGVMIAEPGSLAPSRNNRSDLYYTHLHDLLARLLQHLLPGRRPPQDVRTVTNHDDRAALVCAISALAVAAGDFCAVGDDDGWIILPPRRFIQDWAWAHLCANAAGNAEWLFSSHQEC